MRILGIWFILLLLELQAADQTKPGAGNDLAARIAKQSPRVESARQFLLLQAGRIVNPRLRAATLDAISNDKTCVVHRAGVGEAQRTAILERLRDQGLLDQADDPAGVFPALIDEGNACPKLPQPFYAAPGSSFGGHHSYPGGLLVHEEFNEISSLNLAAAYRRVYGPGIYISQDIMVAAPIWHDWAKTFVFQWNGDGTEFKELNFGGSGTSKTPAHHILGLAETIARGLPPDFVITQASAHAAPTNGQEAKVVSWIRTAAILAQVDPVARGYLARGSDGELHLALVRKLGRYSNTLVEYVLHNISDSDFSFTGTAMTQVEAMLAALAPEFGFTASNTAEYNNHFRNVVLSQLSAERLVIVYGNSGMDGVKAEVRKLKLH